MTKSQKKKLEELIKQVNKDTASVRRDTSEKRLINARTSTLPTQEAAQRQTVSLRNNSAYGNQSNAYSQRYRTEYDRRESKKNENLYSNKSAKSAYVQAVTGLVYGFNKASDLTNAADRKAQAAGFGKYTPSTAPLVDGGTEAEVKAKSKWGQTVESSKAYQVGEIAGSALSYIIPYGATSKAASGLTKALGKTAVSAAAKNAGKKGAMGLVSKIVSKVAGNEAATKLVTEMTKDAIQDATVGAPMNYISAKNDANAARVENPDMTDEEYRNMIAKEFAVAEAQDFGIGGAFDVAAPFVKKGAGKVVGTIADKISDAKVATAAKKIGDSDVADLLKKSTSNVDEVKKAKSALTKDRLFLSALKDNNINISAYAKENGISVAEATNRLYTQYSRGIFTYASPDSVGKIGAFSGSDVANETLKNAGHGRNIKAGQMPVITPKVIGKAGGEEAVEVVTPRVVDKNGVEIVNPRVVDKNGVEIVNPRVVDKNGVEIVNPRVVDKNGVEIVNPRVVDKNGVEVVTPNVVDNAGGKSVREAGNEAEIASIKTTKAKADVVSAKNAAGEFVSTGDPAIDAYLKDNGYLGIKDYGEKNGGALTKDTRANLLREMADADAQRQAEAVARQANIADSVGDNVISREAPVVNPKKATAQNVASGRKFNFAKHEQSDAMDVYLMSKGYDGVGDYLSKNEGQIATGKTHSAIQEEMVAEAEEHGYNSYKEYLKAERDNIVSDAAKNGFDVDAVIAEKKAKGIKNGGRSFEGSKTAKKEAARAKRASQQINMKSVLNQSAKESDNAAKNVAADQGVKATQNTTRNATSRAANVANAADNTKATKAGKLKQTQYGSGVYTTQPKRVIKGKGIDKSGPATKNLWKNGTGTKNIPVNTPYGETSQFATNTLRRVGNKNDVVGAAIDELMPDGSFAKTYQSHKVTIERAEKFIKDRGGVEQAYNELETKWRNGLRFKPEDQAALSMIINEASGDMLDDALILATDVSTDLGRMLESTKIYTALSEVGRQKLVKNAVSRLEQGRGMRAGQIKVSEDLMKKLAEAKGGKELLDAIDEVRIKIWDQIPATLSEKAGAVRYLMMLLNSKTHVRNVAGNVVFMPARGIRNMIAGALEGQLQKAGKLSTRTKVAVWNPFSASSRELTAYAKKQFDDGVGDALRSNSGKLIENTVTGHDLRGMIGTRPTDGKIFSAGGKDKGLFGGLNKTVDWLSKLNGSALDKEDVLAMIPAYTHSFAQFLQANGVKHISDASDDMLKKASDYSQKQALEATYREANVLSRFINKGRAGVNISFQDIKNAEYGREKGSLLLQKGFGTIVDTAMPFVNTPANIAKQAIDYSPLGLIRAAADFATAKTEDDLLKAVAHVGSGLTGTGLFMFGMFLQKNGYMDVSSNSSDYDKYARDVMGKQTNALTSKGVNALVGAYNKVSPFKIDLQGKEYTFDLSWVTPSAIPLFSGALLAQDTPDSEKSSDWLTKSYKLISKASTPFFEQLMLSGLEGIFSTSSYDDDPKIVQIAKNVVKTRIGQYTPTLGSNLRLAAGGYEKDPYNSSTSPDSGRRTLDSTVNYIKSRLPGAAETVQDKIDVWGRKVRDENAALRVANTLISPGRIKVDKSDSVDKEIQALYQKTNSNSIIPKRIKVSDINNGLMVSDIDNKKYKVSPEEYTKFKVDTGKYQHDKLKELFESSRYGKMSDDEKADAISDVYKDAKAYATRQFWKSKGYTGTQLDWNDSSIVSDSNRAEYKQMRKKIAYSQTALDAAKKAGVNLPKNVNISKREFINVLKDKSKYPPSQSPTASMINAITKGHVKNYADYVAKYGGDTSVSKWNLAVNMYNKGVKPKKVSKVFDTFEKAKETGDLKREPSGYMKPEQLQAWISGQNWNRAKKRLYWELCKYSNWTSQNPF